MKNLREKRIRFWGNSVVLPTIILVLMLVLLFVGVRSFIKINEEQSRVLTEQSIKKAAVQCYANEGMYPADLEYLEDNYFVTIDYDRFSVVYDCFASNLMPNIVVYTR